MRKFLIITAALVALIVLPGLVIKRGPSSGGALSTNYDDSSTALGGSPTSVQAAIVAIDTTLDSLTSDHGGLSGLTDDDHTQYPIMTSGTDDPIVTGVTCVADPTQQYRHLYYNTGTRILYGCLTVGVGSTGWTQLPETTFRGAIEDTSFTSGDCMAPQGGTGSVSSGCNAADSALFVPADRNFTVREMWIAPGGYALDGEPEECVVELSEAAASAGIGTSTTVNHVTYFQGSATAIAADLAISALGDDDTITFGTPILIEGGNALGVRFRSPINAECTAAGEPMVCCNGVSDASTCTCTAITRAVWEIRGSWH